MTHYPHSVNHHEALFAAGHFYPAAGIWLKPGTMRRGSIQAQRMAGSAIDLSKVAILRRRGDLHSARARLDFARCARLALS